MTTDNKALAERLQEQADEMDRRLGATDVQALLREAAAALTASPQVDEGRELDRYDAGLLNDFGGGDVDWWQDYIRAELDRAHEFYQSQIVPQPQGDASGQVSGGESGSLPKALHPHAAEWYRLCERAPHTEYVKITGSLGEAIADTIAALSPTQARPDEGIVELRVTTCDPSKYVLHNEDDGGYWRGNDAGQWVREPAPTADGGELLPLPKPPYIDEHNLHGGRLAYSIQQMKDYARANVERALAESRALLVSAHQGAEEARTDRFRAVRERSAAQARAERLAGALREARGLLCAVEGISQNNFSQLASEEIAKIDAALTDQETT